MFRAASRVPRRAVLAAAATGGVVLHEQPREKLSIYPAAEPQVLLEEAPSPLALQLAVYRRHLETTYADSHAYVQGWVSKWISIEQAVENRVKAIVSPNENMTPGLLYVGVATLTGSILARNRFILTRLSLPPIFLIASAHHFLPETTTNLSNYLGSLEDKHFPAFAEKHEIAKAHSQMGLEMAKQSLADARHKLNAATVRSVEKVQDATGLKIKETLGLSDDVVEAVENKAAALVKAAAEKVSDAVESVVNPTEPTVPRVVEPPVAEKPVEEEFPKRLV